VLSEMVTQIVCVVRDHPRLREEVVFVRARLVHPHQISCKLVLTRNALNPRIHVNLLPWIQFRQKVRRYGQIMPRQIKNGGKFLSALAFPHCAFVVLLEVFEFPVANFLSHFSNYIVLRLAHIYYKSVLWICTTK
jgi:hypothetical protein